MKIAVIIALVTLQLAMTTGCSNMLSSNTSSSPSVSTSESIGSSIEEMPANTSEHSLSNVLANAPEHTTLFDSEKFVWGAKVSNACDKIYDDSKSILPNATVTLTTLEDLEKQWGATQMAFHVSEESANQGGYNGAVAYINILPTIYYEDFLGSAYNSTIPSTPFATIDNDQFILTYALSAMETQSEAGSIREEIVNYVRSLVDGTVAIEGISYLDND